jgi:acylpyruvate hydrolase
MRLVTFTESRNSGSRVGALSNRNGENYVIDLQRTGAQTSSSMRQLLRSTDGSFRSLEQAVQSAPASSYLKMSDVALGPVVPDPDKIICIGLNYRDHAQETNLAVPEVPTVFAKYSNTLIGNGDAILIPGTTSRPDYEAELAFVIGRRAKQVREEEAMNYVAGYTIFNDVSARDYQLRTTQWTLGKSFDTFGPIGPALVTKDEIPDPHALGIRLWIGAELLQESNTSNLIFRIPALIAHLSSAMTLEPGDIVATGTPAGVGFTRKPPRYLKDGDAVRIEIDGLGVLQNPVKGN